MTIFDNDGFEESELEDIFQLFHCNMYVDIMDDNTWQFSHQKKTDSRISIDW